VKENVIFMNNILSIVQKNKGLFLVLCVLLILYISHIFYMSVLCDPLCKLKRLEKSMLSQNTISKLEWSRQRESTQQVIRIVIRDIDDASEIKFLKDFPNITWVTFENVNLVGHENILYEFTKLNNLTLDQCSVGEIDFTQLSSNLMYLRFQNMDFSESITTQIENDDQFSAFKNLVTLRITNSNIDRHLDDLLGSCENLKALSLSQVDISDLNEWEHLDGLEILELNDLDHVVDSSLFEQMPNLEQFS